MRQVEALCKGEERDNEGRESQGGGGRDDDKESRRCRDDQRKSMRWKIVLGETRMQTQCQS